MNHEQLKCPRWLTLLPRNPFEVDERELIYDAGNAPHNIIGKEGVRKYALAIDLLREFDADVKRKYKN